MRGDAMTDGEDDDGKKHMKNKQKEEPEIILQVITQERRKA